MSNNLSVTKSVLAKLLATENINVVHDGNLKTAAFDTKNRTLYLPVFESMDGELYDLLVGHEDGHALYTPCEGWHDAIKESNRSRAFKDTMNIIEDARIEKLIKRKYPGLSRSFSKAYKQLFDRDFFGIRSLTDYNSLNLLDRINMYFKCGSFLIIPFSDDERVLVREIANAETWDQVLDISKRVYKLAVEKHEQEAATQKYMSFSGDEQDDDDSESDDGDDHDESDDSDDSDDFRSDSFEDANEKPESERSESDDDSNEDSDENASDSGEESDNSDEESDSAKSDEESDESDDESDDDSDEESDDYDSNYGDYSDDDSNDSSDDDELHSVTDSTFRDREQELVVGGTNVYTCMFPRPILENIIVPARIITDNFFSHITGNVKPLVDKFNSTNNRYISMLVKEFEMRKNAGQFARRRTARTGELDMNKLYQYRYNNDIFRKITVTPKGKNHGIILFLDMSGSMRGIFGPTVEQTLTLAVFCKRAGIPFDVYGFSNNSTLLHNQVYEGKLSPNFLSQKKFVKGPIGDEEYSIDSEDEFHLMHLLSSDFSMHQWRSSFEMMCVVAMCYAGDYYIDGNRYQNWTAAGFGLQSTPFLPTLFASRDIIERFKDKHGVDIANVIYMTDGDGTGNMTFTKISRDYSVRNRVFLVDQKTKMKVEIQTYGAGAGVSSTQENITKFVRELTGCKHIGFYLCKDKEYRRKFKAISCQCDAKQLAALTKENHDNDFFSHTNIGYDMYFFMKAHTANIEDEDFQITDKMTNKKIAKVFTDAQENKRRNRSLVAKLAQEIATV